MSNERVPEARIFLKALNFYLSSTEMQATRQYVSPSLTLTKMIPRHPATAEGGAVTYDFQSVKFRYKEQSDGLAVLSVERDDLLQDKEIRVNGLLMAEGFDLEGRMFVKLLPNSPKTMSFNKEKKVEIKQIRINKDKVNILFIVDVYDWAWDIASRELLKAMPTVNGVIVSVADLGRVNPQQYNVVLVYPWASTGLMSSLDPRNTVVCVAGGEQLDLLPNFRRLCGRFNFYGACNKKIQARLEEEFPTKTVFHLTHGVDSNLFTPSKRRQHEEFSIGWVGSTERDIKRFPLAETIAAEGGFKLRVAGFKKYTHNKMPRFYHSVDCLLVTSVTEAHPLVVYEAMSCGLPVVTTNVGDVSTYITHGENGFILPVDAPVAKFVETLNTLKKDTELRTRVGEAARQTVIEKLSWSEIAKQYEPLVKIMEDQRK